MKTVIEIAHRTCWRYKKSTDPHHSDTYTFNDATLKVFSDLIRKDERNRAPQTCENHCERNAYQNEIRRLKTDNERDYKNWKKAAESYVTALKVIHTWASVEGALVREHVISLCDKTLGRAE